MGDIVNLSAFRAAQERKGNIPDPRVWDRVRSGYDQVGFGPSGLGGQMPFLIALEGAIDSMAQYLDNEWPIENGNRVRAAECAEITALLFYRGNMSADAQISDKAVDLQTQFLGIFDTSQFQETADRYRKTVCKLVDATQHAMEEAARQAVPDHDQI